MKKYAYIIVAIIVSYVFYSGMSTLESRQEPLLENAERGYVNGTTLNLDCNVKRELLAQLLLTNGYVDSDTTDANLIADWIVERINKNGGKLNNLGALNTDSFYIPARIVQERGGEYMKERLHLSYSYLEYDSVVAQYYSGERIVIDS